MDTKKITRTGILLALALVFQIVFRLFAQPIVGPLVNMTLIIATLIVGPLGAMLIGVLTPTVALMLGIIGMPPLVPVIVIGNCVFVTFYYLCNQWIKHNYRTWISIVPAATGKFIFLALSVRFILPYFIPKVPEPVIQTFSLPQLVTALGGGILAIVIYEFIKKRI